ncbi:unnamed protein product [Closterium sp. NIES-65]|nr:unnamed protein product [Closterium sp. NIES-65]
MAIGGDAGGGDMDEDEAMMIMMAEDETDLIRRAEQAAKEEARRVGQMGRLQPLLAKWRRQPVTEFDPRKTDIVFQQLDIDYYLTSDSPFKTHYKSSAVLRIFGVNEHGNSVCAMVHGFLPYFYVMAPSQFTYDDVAAFHTQLSERGQAKGVVVIRVEMLKAQGLLYYQGPDKKTFLKITLALPTMVAPCRAYFEQGFEWNGFQFPATTYESNVLFALRFMIDCHVTGGNWISLPAGTYRVREDARKLSACQLEVDIFYTDLVSHEGTGQWSRMAPFRILSFDIECSGRKGHFPEPQHDPVIQIANIVSQQGSSDPLVRTVLTLGSCAPIVGCDVVAFETEQQLLLAWKHDPVIQIANIVSQQGSSDPLVRTVLTLGSCAPIVGCDVVAFETEQQLLLAWKELIQATDPDMIIGYNIQKFDLPYLIERAEKLNLKTFPFLGRILNTQLKMRDARFQSRQYGTRETKEVTLDGRVQFDLLVAIQREHKLSSYSLNSVSAHFLNEQKEDVHHSIIADLQNGDAQTRRRLAVYCLKDAYLPQRLLEKLMMVYNYVEMARVTGVPISFLLARGQSIKVRHTPAMTLTVCCLKDAYLLQRLFEKLRMVYNHVEMARVTGVPISFLLAQGQIIKVLSQILRKARQRELLVPNMKVQAGAGADATYEGATVLEPKQGFYERPVATLDFASLYPSIMMAHNLCYCTLVQKEHGIRPPDDQISQTPTGDLFVKASAAKGILPEILEELLAARKRAKADLKVPSSLLVVKASAAKGILPDILEELLAARKRAKADFKALAAKGILPEILEELLAARKRAKANLKKATDPLEKAVLDGRQLALKLRLQHHRGHCRCIIMPLLCMLLLIFFPLPSASPQVSANSVYGFTGATIGALPCLEISSSVTAYGRQMIEHTRAFVEQHYSIANGYSHNADVVYGDTDSVMVMFGVDTVEEAMRMGRQAAEEISDTFPKVCRNRLEFEKVYFPYLLINKKRYAGLYWSNSKAFDKMDTKGIEMAQRDNCIETVRRDNCLLVRQVVGECLQRILREWDILGAVAYVKAVVDECLWRILMERDIPGAVAYVVDECLRRILMERDIPGAVAYVKAVISDLLMNKLDLSLLVITKALTKGGDDYAVKAAHVQLAERMRKRDPATAPGIGDRVAYVICKAPKGSKVSCLRRAVHVACLNLPISQRDSATAPDRVAYVICKAPKGNKAYEKSEDPIHVLENNIPIDPHYYLENQLSKPLLRIFEPILRNANKELLSDAHARAVSISTALPPLQLPLLRIFEPILKNASKELLSGAHTRAVSISTPSTGGIMRFAKVRLSCLGCKTPLSGNSQTLCVHCMDREGEIYQRITSNVRECEEQFGRLWVECQRCQGSLHQDVLCTSRDCPIFYRRKKAQKDVEESHAQLARFDF